MKTLEWYSLLYKLGLLTEDRWAYFCAVDFHHMNLDPTIKAFKFDELQIRLWFLNGAGSWATVGNDYIIRIWKLMKDGELSRIHEITDHTDVVTDIQYAAKIDCFISSSLDGSLRLMTASNFRTRHIEIISKKPGGATKPLKPTILSQSKKEKNIEGVRGNRWKLRFFDIERCRQFVDLLGIQ